MPWSPDAITLSIDSDEFAGAALSGEGSSGSSYSFRATSRAPSVQSCSLIRTASLGLISLTSEPVCAPAQVGCSTAGATGVGRSIITLNFVERSPNLRRLRIKGIFMGNLRISAFEAKTEPKLRMAVNKMRREFHLKERF